MNKVKIGVLVGSARRDSYSMQVAQILAADMPDHFDAAFIGLSHLPLFNQDYDDDGTVPSEWAAFRNEIEACDAFLFVTPEYNRSYTPLLKNALDIASRPPGHNLWSGKPGAVVGVSPGALGAFGAVAHLRQVLGFLGVPLLMQPEIYLSGIGNLLDANGRLTNESTAGFLKKFIGAYADWVGRFVQ